MFDFFHPDFYQSQDSNELDSSTETDMAAMGDPTPEIEDDNNDEDDLEIVKPPLRYGTVKSYSTYRLELNDILTDRLFVTLTDSDFD